MRRASARAGCRVRAAAATLCFAAIASFSAAAFGAPSVGDPAPALRIARIDGSPFDLEALHGKVVIVNFWATWCTPCREEMPALDAFYRDYHDRGVEMIGLSADRPHDRDDVLKVMQRFAYPAAVLTDARKNGFGRPGVLPVTYVIDAHGVIRAKLTPDQVTVTSKTLSDAVLPLLGH